MNADYLAWKISKHQGNLDVLATDNDSSVSSAAFHYREATWHEESNEKRPDEFRNQWKPHVNDYGLRELARTCEQPDIRLEQMPLLTTHLSFKVVVNNKPFLSRDDDPFYIIDNPVKKDKVFKLPYASPSSWKGALRSVARYVRQTPPDIFDPIIERLFGTDKRREAESLKQGRLHFFPTFFSSIGLEVINPHDRKSGAGTLPIQLETASGEGQFNLLYFPFDLDSSPKAFSEAAEDIRLIAKSVREMFTAYGFGAKTSSGFGVADVVKEGRLRMRFEESLEVKASIQQQIPDKLAPFFTPENQLREFTELEMSKWGRQRQRDYEKARKLSAQMKAESTAPVEIPPAPAAPVTVRDFTSWQGLTDKAEELAVKVREKGGEQE